MKIKYELSEADIKAAIAEHVARVHNVSCITKDVTIHVSERYDRNESACGYDITAEATQQQQRSD